MLWFQFTRSVILPLYEYIRLLCVVALCNKLAESSVFNVLFLREYYCGSLHIQKDSYFGDAERGYKRYRNV
jgi:hypothetical protein